MTRTLIEAARMISVLVSRARSQEPSPDPWQGSESCRQYRPIRGQNDPYSLPIRGKCESYYWPIRGKFESYYWPMRGQFDVQRLWSVTCPILDHPPVCPGPSVVILAQKTPWMDMGIKLDLATATRQLSTKMGSSQASFKLFPICFLLLKVTSIVMVSRMLCSSLCIIRCLLINNPFLNCASCI